MRMPVMSPGVYGTVPAFRTKPLDSVANYKDRQACMFRKCNIIFSFTSSALIPSLQKQRDLGEGFLLRVDSLFRVTNHQEKKKIL